MRLCVILFAPDRSGQHAVMEWICHQARPSVYFNICIADANRIQYLKDHVVFDGDSNKTRRGRGKDFPHQHQLYVKSARMLGFLAPKHLDKPKWDGLVKNKVVYESWYLKHDLFTQRETVYLVLVRDIYNLLASQEKTWGGRLQRPHYIEATCVEWVENIKVALGDMPVPRDIGCLHVNFNRWHADHNYRKRLAKRLGLTFNDTWKAQHTRNFTGLSRFRGGGSDINSRWQHQEFEFWKYITDEMHELNERYFGFSLKRYGDSLCEDFLDGDQSEIAT